MSLVSAWVEKHLGISRATQRSWLGSSNTTPTFGTFPTTKTFPGAPSTGDIWDRIKTDTSVTLQAAIDAYRRSLGTIVAGGPVTTTTGGTTASGTAGSSTAPLLIGAALVVVVLILLFRKR